MKYCIAAVHEILGNNISRNPATIYMEQAVYTIRQRKPGIPIQVIYVYPKARLDFEEVMERRAKRSIQLEITHKIIDPAEIKVDFFWQ